MGALVSKLIPASVRAIFSPKERLKIALQGFELPDFPGVVSEILGDLRREDFNVGKAGKKLAGDPKLSIEILRHVNSAAFGLRNPVKAVEHATAFLGRQQLESVLLAVGVQRALPQSRKSKSRGGFDAKAFWSGARRRAWLAGEIAAVATPHLRAESVTAALLQDMAIPAFAFARPEYASVLQTFARGEDDLVDLEQSVLGLDHAEVGGWLCEHWRLPPELTASISQHHSPDANCDFPAASVASMLDATSNQQNNIERVITLAQSRLGIAHDVAVAILADLNTRAM